MICSDGKWMIVSQRRFGDSGVYYGKYAGSMNKSDWNWVNIADTTNFDLRNNDIPWMVPAMFDSTPSSFIVNKRYYNKDSSKLSVLFSSIVVWMNDDILNGSTTPWYTKMHGFEEVFLLDLATPSKGIHLVTGIADVEGFIHENIDQYPKERIYLANATSGGQLNTDSVDFCESNPMIIVRSPGNGGQDGKYQANASITTDQGKTWKDLPSHSPFVQKKNGQVWDVLGGTIRMAPTNCDHMVWIPFSDYPYVTMDGGKTWSNTTGSFSVIYIYP